MCYVDRNGIAWKNERNAKKIFVRSNEVTSFHPK